MDRIQTSTKAVDKFGAGKHGFTAGNPATGTPATQLSETFFDSVQEEICSVIESAGIALDPVDRAQLASAIQSGALNVAAAGGTADAITAAFSPAITALSDGLLLHVRAAAANATTAPTFTPADGVIAAKAVVKGNGLALVAGDIAGVGRWLLLQYDATLDKWVLLNPATGVVAGLQVASDAEAQALADNTKAITPYTLAQAFKAANQSLGTSGYQRMPGGLIVQFGSAPVNSAVTFPVAFPVACRSVTVSPSASNNGSGQEISSPYSISVTGFQIAGDYSGTAYWIAIGH